MASKSIIKSFGFYLIFASALAFAIDHQRVGEVGDLANTPIIGMPTVSVTATEIFLALS